MKLGVLDLGSNSFHLLVAKVEEGAIDPLDKHKIMVRLGAGTLRTGRLDAETMRRGLDAVAALVERARAKGAKNIVAVATSALRDSANRGEFIERARKRSDVEIEILSGVDEGRLIYLGASDGARGRRVVVDVGGGSVEIIAGDGPEPRVVHSLPLGVIRLREGMVPADGFVSERTAEEIVAAVSLAAARAAEEVNAFRPETLVFTSGTARTVARLAAYLAGPTAAEDGSLRADSIAQLAQILTKLTPAALVALGVEEERTETIGVGALILHALVHLLGFSLVEVSDRALREGVAFRELQRQRA